MEEELCDEHKGNDACHKERKEEFAANPRLGDEQGGEESDDEC